MKIKYDSEIDAMYIYFSDKKPTKTEEVKEGLILDYNGAEITGMEILNVSKTTSYDLEDISVSISKTTKHI